MELWGIKHPLRKQDIKIEEGPSLMGKLGPMIKHTSKEVCHTSEVAFLVCVQVAYHQLMLTNKPHSKNLFSMVMLSWGSGVSACPVVRSVLIVHREK